MPEPATPATSASVHELATALKLGEAAYDRAAELADLRPDKSDWLRYLDRFLMAAATLLIVAGIAAFFAWNWQAMHHFTKFALIQAGIVATVIAAWRLRIDSIAGRASLLSAAFLVGILLAVFGQVYQTGADPYGLFLAWAVLILPWGTGRRCCIRPPASGRCRNSWGRTAAAAKPYAYDQRLKACSTYHTYVRSTHDHHPALSLTSGRTFS